MKIIGITSTAILSLLLGIAAPAYAQHDEQGEKQDHPQQQGAHEQGKPEQQHAQQQPEHAQQQEKQEQQAQHSQQQAQQKQEQQTQRNQQQAQQKQQQQAQHNQHQAQQEQEQQVQHNQQQTQHNQQQAQQNQEKARYNQRQAQQKQPPQRTEQRIQQSAWQEHRSQNWQSDHRTWDQRGGYRGYRIPDDRYRGYFGLSHEFRIYGLPFLVVGGYPRFQYQGYWISTVDPWPEAWGNDWYDNDDVYVNYVDNGYYLYNRNYPSQGIAINITL